MYTLCTCTCPGQDPTYYLKFFPSTTWVEDMELRLSELETGALPVLPCYLANCIVCTLKFVFALIGLYVYKLIHCVNNNNLLGNFFVLSLTDCNSDKNCSCLVVAFTPSTRRGRGR